MKPWTMAPLTFLGPLAVPEGLYGTYEGLGCV